MAELAIPIIALGGLFIMSKNNQENINENNKKDDKQKLIKPLKYSNNSLKNNNIENYENLNKIKLQTGYPEIKPVSSNNINYYQNNKQSIDKYFSQNKYNNINNNTPNNQVKSISGDIISKNNFTHNNMVPFFGGKIKGATSDYNTSESVLDNMQGTGSQYITKSEIAPLFNPSNNMQYTHGMPNVSDFIQSRQVAGNKISNVTPWKQVQVGPGLNDGYNVSSNNGFNDSLLNRDTWQPKNVDELRSKTNPKLTFDLEGHQGPAISKITQLGIQGKIEKHRPEGFYKSGPERWLTTTGQEKAQTVRSNHILKDQKNNDPSEYFGIASDKEATYIKGNYETSNKQNLPSCQIQHIHSKNAAPASISDLTKINILPNNRYTTNNNDVIGISGFGKAVIAPLIDFLKPTKKEDNINNPRVNGNVNTNNTKEYVKSDYNIMKITNRQMTTNKLDLNHLNVDGVQQGHAYQIAKHHPDHVQKRYYKL